jgi:hypothetical protein
LGHNHVIASYQLSFGVRRTIRCSRAFDKGQRSGERTTIDEPGMREMAGPISAGRVAERASENPQNRFLGAADGEAPDDPVSRH